MKVKPVLIPDQINGSLIINTNIEPNGKGDIILVDPEAEIVEGDLFIGDNVNLRICTQNNAGNINFKGGWYSGSTNCSKVIASTNREHTVPQLSKQSKLLLIDYYNSNGKMPESVEVEKDYYTDPKFRHLEEENPSIEIIKLNPQGTVDITIPEESGVYYCKAQSKTLPCSHYYKDGRCLHPFHCNFKAKEKLYTEEQMHSAYLSGMNRGGNIARSPDYYSLCDKDDFKEWLDKRSY